MCFCLFFGLVFLFGGFKGQARWPKGSPHLALNPPSYFGCFFCCFLFFLLLEGKALFFPVKRTFWFIFQCLPLFLPSLFCFFPPLSHYLFLSLLLCSFFAPFLFSFFLALVWFLAFGSLFLPCFFAFVS